MRTNSRIRRRFARHGARSVLLCLATTLCGYAQGHLEKLERAVDFHIAAGSLETALIQFSRETQSQLVVSVSVADISVAAVEGHRIPREVLLALLCDTGLTFKIIGATVAVYSPTSVP